MSFNGVITYEGSRAPSQMMVDAAVQHALNVRMQKTHAGQPRMSKAFDLPDGTQVYVLDYEHVWKVHIVPPAVPEPEEPPLPEYEYELDTPVPIAGMLSGAVYTGTMDQELISWPTDDPETGAKKYPQPVPIILDHLFGLTPESAELFPVPQASFKLAVEPYHTHGTLGDTYPRTQFQHVIPGKYTGGLALVVQLLLGVGRVVSPDYEARWRTKNNSSGIFGEVTKTEGGEVVDVQEARDVDSVYFDTSRSKPIGYDYRWNRTNGLIWGSDNTGNRAPILVEVGTRGVHAMPFPVDELSTFDKVQDYYERVYPALAQYAPFRNQQETLFEALKGFPSGDNMPGDTEQLERWIRAGAVTAAENDMSEFYDGTWNICTQFGWAFHPSEPEAMNTGVRADGKHKIGVCYKLNFDVVEKPEQQQTRNPLYPQVVAALQLTEWIDFFKAKRLTEQQALQIIATGDYDAFDAMEVDSDWTVEARLSLIREGIIDYPYFQCPGGPADPCEQIDSPHFKYYEPIIGEVLNFNFENRDMDDSTIADGPIFATYTTEGAEILNYYFRKSENESTTVNTRQQCQYTGSWLEATYGSSVSLRGYFYSTSKDFRQELRFGTALENTISSRVIGYADYIRFCGFVAQQATLQRHYFGTQNHSLTYTGGKGYSASVSCASNNRSAFFVCQEWTESEKRTYKSFSGRIRFGDSGSVHAAHMYHFIWHWVSCFPWDCLDHGDPICRLRVCHTSVDADACMGTDEPSIPEYAVCDPEGGGSAIVTASHPGLDSPGVLSAYYTNLPTAPPSWNTGWSSPQWTFKWKIWGMGLDLMNAVEINSGEEIVDDWQEKPFRASDGQWWKCAIPGLCPSPTWPVGQNLYGMPFVVTYDDLDWSETVEFGARPEVAFGTTSVPFGVLE